MAASKHETRSMSQKILRLRGRFLSDPLRKSANIIILTTYALLSIVFTYPVAFAANKIPGHGDVFFCLWELWWFKEAVVNHINPYYTSYIFYPNGINLIFGDLSPIIGLLSVPLQLAVGLVNTYNIIWIASFILSGYGAYLLVKYLTNDDIRAAFISGIVFMFCPYHFAHALGHLSLFNMEWIPFYVLYLIKMTKERNIANSLYAAFFLLITGMTSTYYLIYLLVFTLIYVIYFAWFDKGLNKVNFIKKMGVMGVSFIIALSPFLYLIIKEILETRSNYMYATGFVEYSADILAFFTPSTFHPLLSGLFSSVNSRFTGGPAENTVFAGYTVLLLSIIAISKARSKEVVFWALSALTFFVLSLGPILHILGTFRVQIEDYTAYVLLPYALMMHIPLFSAMRVPSRWDVLIMLCLAVLVGYGLTYIFSSSAKIKCFKVKGISCKNALFLIFISLILFEFLALPYPIMSSAEIPSFYKQMAVDKEDYALLELPYFGPASEYMYYQTAHGKRLINGFAARIPDGTLSICSTPFIDQLIDGSHHDDIISRDWKKEAVPILKSYKIRYIVIHKNLMSPANFQFVVALLNESIGLPQKHENGSIVTYCVPDNDFSKSPRIALGSGWYGLESWNGTPSRWIAKDATVIIHSDTNHTVDLSLRVLSFLRTRVLEIYAESSLVAKKTAITNFVDNRSRIDLVQVTVPTSFINVSVPIHLTKGANIVQFHVPEGCERPSDKPELNNPDSRCLSVAVQNLTVV